VELSWICWIRGFRISDLGNWFCYSADHTDHTDHIGHAFEP
jgi:hypothetical protein